MGSGLSLACLLASTTRFPDPGVGADPATAASWANNTEKFFAQARATVDLGLTGGRSPTPPRGVSLG